MNATEDSPEFFSFVHMAKGFLGGYILLVSIFYAYHYFSALGEVGALSRMPLLPFIEAISIYLSSLCICFFCGLLYSGMSRHTISQSLKIGISKTNIVAVVLFVLVLSYIKNM
ncbi:MAG: hypothetical protein COA99_09360 [Moraxellaceae bacterium]|nr:MAG: hypothetical protein COA99_09360 [Moraxellaceae bacterium]